MKKVLALVLIGLFTADLLAESMLTLDKLDRSDLADSKKRVAFSALLEGTVSSPDLDVFVMVQQPHLKAWRAFPATVDNRPEAPGRFRWRAICQFGELKGMGVGSEFQARAYALDKLTVKDGLPQRIPPEALKTEVIVLKRTK